LTLREAEKFPSTRHLLCPTYRHIIISQLVLAKILFKPYARRPSERGEREDRMVLIAYIKRTKAMTVCGLAAHASNS